MSSPHSRPAPDILVGADVMRALIATTVRYIRGELVLTKSYDGIAWLMKPITMTREVSDEAVAEAIDQLMVGLGEAARDLAAGADSQGVLKTLPEHPAEGEVRRLREALYLTGVMDKAERQNLLRGYVENVLAGHDGHEALMKARASHFGRVAGDVSTATGEELDHIAALTGTARRHGTTVSLEAGSPLKIGDPVYVDPSGRVHRSQPGTTIIGHYLGPTGTGDAVIQLLDGRGPETDEELRARHRHESRRPYVRQRREALARGETIEMEITEREFYQMHNAFENNRPVGLDQDGNPVLWLPGTVVGTYPSLRVTQVTYAMDDDDDKHRVHLRQG